MKYATFLKIIGAVATVLGAPLLGISLTPKRDAVAKAQETAVDAIPSGARPKPIPTSDFVGVLVPENVALIRSEATTKVDAIHVKVGQAVRKGQKLLALDPRNVEAQIKEAEGRRDGALGSASAAAAQARAAASRAGRRNETVDIGGGRKIALTSKEDTENAVADRAAAAGNAASASGQARAAKAQIDQLKLALEHMEPVAPWDGFVQTIAVEKGETVLNGNPLITLVGVGGSLRARIAIPENAQNVWNGRRRAQLDIEINGQPRTLWAVIDQVSPQVDEKTRMFLIEGPVPVTPEMCGGPCATLGNKQIKATLISDNER